MQDAAKARAALKEHQLFIDGRYLPAAGGKTFEKFSPVTGALIARVHEAGREDVDRAVKAARAALNGPWGALTVKARCDLLLDLAQKIAKRSGDFLDAEVADTGKPRKMAAELDIPRGAANFSIFADMIKNLGSEFFETPHP